jgi:nicotinamide mononucleotide transporter
MNYLSTHWLELFAVITAIIYLYFSINRKSWLWVLGIISSGVFTVVFFRHSLYADMILNLYYVFVSIYGWITWTTNKEAYHSETHQIDILRITKKEVHNMILFGVILFFIIFIPIKYMPKILNINSASLPLIDSILTTLSFVATWMLVKRYLEQWYLWIVVNGFYILVYGYKGLYFTVILNIVYTIMSVLGYIKWRKSLTIIKIEDRI